MSFSPLIYRKKLDALQDTQDLIVSISQWLLFHHRHSREICDLWAEYILSNDASINLKKRLALLYLCNDVVQQARHKREPEFSRCFATVLPNIFHKIYESMDSKLQPKLDRLVGVWDQRNIFTKGDIVKMRSAIESLKSGTGLDESEQNHSVGVGLGHGRGLIIPQIAPEMVPLNDLYTQLSKTLDSASANLSQVGVQCKLYLPQNPEMLENLPLPNVYITKLNVLEKLCNMTTQNLQEAVDCRKSIIALLAELSSSLSEGLASDEAKAKIIEQRLLKLQATKEELHEMIGILPEETEEPVPEVPQAAKGQLDVESAPVEDPSPTFELANDDDSNSMPTYEDSSDSDSEDSSKDDGIAVKRQKLSDNSATVSSTTSDSSSFSTSRPPRKTVAFSEDIEIKEFVREEHAEVGRIVRSDTDTDDDALEEDDTTSPAEENELRLYESHHKDSAHLLHEKKHDCDEDSYDPSMLGHSDSATHEPPQNSNDDGVDQDQSKAGLLSLLSKLT